jgi:hypothetical protein
MTEAGEIKGRESGEIETEDDETEQTEEERQETRRLGKQFTKRIGPILGLLSPETVEKYLGAQDHETIWQALNIRIFQGDMVKTTGGYSRNRRRINVSSRSRDDDIRK